MTKVIYVSTPAMIAPRRRCAISKRPAWRTARSALSRTMPTTGTRTVGGNGSVRKRVDRDGDGVDDRAEGAGKGAGVGATSGALPVCSRA